MVKPIQQHEYAQVSARIRLSDLKMLERIISRYESNYDAATYGDVIDYNSDEKQAVHRLRQLVTNKESKNEKENS